MASPEHLAALQSNPSASAGGRTLKARGTRRGIATFTSKGGIKMCILCIQGNPQDHSGSPSGSQLGRRDFLKASTATAAAPAGVSLVRARPSRVYGVDSPQGSNRCRLRHVIQRVTII